jgi:hypothetical protein
MYALYCPRDSLPADPPGPAWENTETIIARDLRRPARPGPARRLRATAARSYRSRSSLHHSTAASDRLPPLERGGPRSLLCHGAIARARARTRHCRAPADARKECQTVEICRNFSSARQAGRGREDRRLARSWGMLGRILDGILIPEREATRQVV